ncbi:uncharacterized protein LOC118734507 [Rhagoletis pomonella]|uniref:uncharacterized protein LOC118734507 n=1 Tax=Rhagoletis pomonella TaxID=28610 RepID=UPI0017820BCE|nr:uncharacterized protein LOC118734507 [Rhagoletis pomonella]
MQGNNTNFTYIHTKPIISCAAFQHFIHKNALTLSVCLGKSAEVVVLRANYGYLVENACNAHVIRPPLYLTTTTTATKKHSRVGYSAFACVVVALLVFAQISARSTATPLTQQADTESESLESAEDILDLLHELVRFSHGEHKIDGTEEFGEKHALMRRLFKRHNADEPEWQNVCGQDSGWSGDEVPEDIISDYTQLYFKTLRKSVRLEYKALKSKAFNDIDIDDMKAWARHYRKYKFLPTLEHHAAIAPVCWHQSMQKFIASFAYLYKIQQHWDQQHLRTQSGIARELHGLLQSARRIQCEIETAIKGSFPRDKRQLVTYTRNDMLALINFYTKNSTAGGGGGGGGGATAAQRGVHSTDLRFAKFFYQNYLLRIWKSLPRHLKNIQLQHTCDKHTHHTPILDNSLDSEESIMNSEMDGDYEE